MGDFKAHSERLGPRLGAQVRLGPGGLARRYGGATGGELEEQRALYRRAVERSAAEGLLTEAEVLAAAGKNPFGATGGGLEETDESKLLARGLAGPASRLGGKVGGKEVGGKGKMGRPRRVGEAPWEAAGLSRTEFYRRRKAGVL